MKRNNISKDLIRMIIVLFVLFLTQATSTTNVIRNYSIGRNLDIEMIFIEGGTFRMGDVWDDENAGDNEYPVHEVILSDYYLASTEVTNYQYCEFLNDWGNQEEAGYLWLEIEGDYMGECLIEKRGGGFYPKSGYDDHPVIYVTWYGARAFCEWLKKETGEEYRLPTEAEWEYAARSEGSEDNRYAGTDVIEELYLYSNYADENFVKEFEESYGWGWGDRDHNDGYLRTAPVGNYRPNSLGLYDMTGNVFEWCSDWNGREYYKNSPVNNPTGPTSGNYANRVIRGGCWSINLKHLRVTHRNLNCPDGSWNSLGFRLCRTGN